MLGGLPRVAVTQTDAARAHRDTGASDTDTSA
jgi:hypothetical protein